MKVYINPDLKDLVSPEVFATLVSDLEEDVINSGIDWVDSCLTHFTSQDE